MRIVIRAFGKFFDLEFGTSAPAPEPVSREEAIATASTPSAQIEFGFTQPDRWRYPEERWLES